MANTLKIVLCGGAGISIGDKVVNKLDDLGSGFSNIDKYYIDTSDSNISKIVHDENKFFLVKNTSSSGTDIDGSGGERRSNFDAINVNIREFIDKHKLNKKATGEYHVAVFSCAGGSGSVIGPLYVKECLNNNIPVIAIVIGDNTNALFATNTKNTLATLDNFAKTDKKCLSIVYVNNTSFKDKVSENEKKANKYLYNMLSAISIFLSGENEALDYKDMENFLGLHIYKTVATDPGLYNLILFSGSEINLPDDAIPIASRSLIVDNASPDLDLVLLTSKHGIITDPNAVEIYGASVPMHLMSTTNFLENEKVNLEKITENFYNVQDAIKAKSFAGSSRSTATDDGFVL